jgi:hypothetical protein
VARTRVVFLVLDGLPASSAGPEVTPVLERWCTDSGTTIRSVPAALPASTYPNHATFVTGVAPAVHGIVGNHVRCADGRVRPARRVGPSVPTVFDACARAGVSSRVVVGDQDLIGVMGAHAADGHWPPDGRVPEGAAVDAHGYLEDDVTMPHLLDALASEAELVVGHLNAPDTAGHVLGPARAKDVYRATDARLEPVRATIEARADDTVTIVVSDHSMEEVVDPRPVDLTEALDGTGLTWFPEGSAALVYGGHDDLGPRLSGIDGVAGVQQLTPELHLVWGDEGRWLCFAGIDGEAGMHGSPRTASQLAAVVGTSPIVRELDARVGADGFDATSWHVELCGLLGLA